MKTTYHISPSDQIARKCDAPIRGCNFGIPAHGHLSAEDAVEHNAKIAQGDNPVFQSLKKSKKRQTQIWEEEPPKQSQTEQNAIKVQRKSTNKSNSTEEQNKQRKAFYNSQKGSMTQFHIISTKDIPQDVQELIMRKGDIREISSLSSNPYISEKTMMEIPIYNPIVADSIVSNPKASNKVLKRVLLESIAYKDNEIFENLILHENTDAEIIDNISLASKSPHVRLLSARSSKASEDTLMRLSQSKSELIQLTVARNKNSSSKVLENLMKNTESKMVQEEISKNPNANNKISD